MPMWPGRKGVAASAMPEPWFSRIVLAAKHAKLMWLSNAKNG